jgi:hypothetical protein
VEEESGTARFRKVPGFTGNYRFSTMFCAFEARTTWIHRSRICSRSRRNRLEPWEKCLPPYIGPTGEGFGRISQKSAKIDTKIFLNLRRVGGSVRVGRDLPRSRDEREGRREGFRAVPVSESGGIYREAAMSAKTDAKNSELSRFLIPELSRFLIHASLHALQLLPRPPDASRYASYASWAHRSRLGD